MEYYSFIHFGINTINNVEWGKGSENIAAFNPKKLDTDQWCSVLKETGSKGVIITAKHHDGFCLWATKETDHCVTNTPFKKDIVKMLSDSCKKYGLEFGIYLSPWDRHEKTYGTEEYNDFYIRQLKELCTNYGEVFCFWFDGACGEGPNGKKQVYDWQRYYSTIRELQPNAVISVCGPDVRWIGNEAGKVRESEWSVVPADKEKEEAIMENSQQTDDGGKEVSKTDERDADLGSREVLRNHSELMFKPAEADVSINLGWFWHGNLYYLFKKNRTAKDLADLGIGSAGDLGHHLNDGDLDANGSEIVSHFQADNTAADNHQILGKGLHIQDFTVGNHKATGQTFLQAGNGRNHSLGAAGNCQAASVVSSTVCLNGEATLYTACNLCIAGDNGDLVGAHGSANTGDQSLNDFIFSVNHLSVVVGSTGNGDTKGCAFGGMTVHLGRVQQGLGRNAAFIQTSTTQGSLLEQSDFQAALSSTLGAQITAGAAANNKQVEQFHSLLPRITCSAEQ